MLILTFSLLIIPPAAGKSAAARTIRKSEEDYPLNLNAELSPSSQG
jgi:hypothetical protein